MPDLLRDQYRVWLRRYLPAELACLPAALLGGWAGSALVDNLVGAALGELGRPRLLLPRHHRP